MAERQHFVERGIPVAAIVGPDPAGVNMLGGTAPRRETARERRSSPTTRRATRRRLRLVSKRARGHRHDVTRNVGATVIGMRLAAMRGQVLSHRGHAGLFEAHPRSSKLRGMPARDRRRAADLRRRSPRKPEPSRPARRRTQPRTRCEFLIWPVWLPLYLCFADRS